jgi:hypothetical protein
MKTAFKQTIVFDKNDVINTKLYSEKVIDNLKHFKYIQNIIDIENENEFGLSYLKDNNYIVIDLFHQVCYIESGTKLYYDIVYTLFNSDNELEETFLHFDIGDDTDMVCHWFEDFFNITLGKFLNSDYKEYYENN